MTESTDITPGDEVVFISDGERVDRRWPIHCDIPIDGEVYTVTEVFKQDNQLGINLEGMNPGVAIGYAIYHPKTGHQFFRKLPKIKINKSIKQEEPA